MAFNSLQKPFHRHSIRLPEYDYSEVGSYFVTLLTHGREPVFGNVIDSKVRLSPAGRIVWEVWKALPKRYPQVELDSAVVMPNHFHAIITINDDSEVPDSEIRATDVGDSNIINSDVRAIHELPLRKSDKVFELLEHDSNTFKESNRRARRRMLLPLVVGYFKMQTGKQINFLRNTPGQPVWHRNYFEHIISTDKEFETISDYIEYNPTNWGNRDEYY